MKPEKVISINTAENPSAAFERVMRGANLVADAVKLTLGPYGRNFLIERTGKTITNDGVSIAHEIQAKDEIEELGVRAMREASIKTNERAGDGTTTTAVIAQAILKECSRFLPKPNVFPKRSVLSIKRQIEQECKEVIEKLAAMAEPIEKKEDLVNVARVSVEDEELAKLIGEAQWEIGPHGHIIAEETAAQETSIERINGIRIDNGLGTTMVMNDTERKRLALSDVSVILTNYTIGDLSLIRPILDSLLSLREEHIVIVAKAFSSDCIRQIMENHKRGVRIYPINAPYVNQREVFKDLEASLGGRYIHDEDSELSSLTVLDVGRAKKVIGYQYSAVFTGTNNTEKRVEELEKQLKGEHSEFKRRNLQERIAQLKNGFALLRIGDADEINRKYKYDKAEDAVHAVRSAFQEGTVVGAGIAMKKIAEEMPDDALLKRPLISPYQQIMANAGEEFAVPGWVRNSLKVERVALENACKIAGILLTVGGAVAVEKIKPLDELANKLKS